MAGRHPMYLRHSRDAQTYSAASAPVDEGMAYDVEDTLHDAAMDVAKGLGLKVGNLDVQDRGDGTGKVTFDLTSKGTVLFKDVVIAIYNKGKAPAFGGVTWPNTNIFNP